MELLTILEDLIDFLRMNGCVVEMVCGREERGMTRIYIGKLYVGLLIGLEIIPAINRTAQVQLIVK